MADTITFIYEHIFHDNLHYHFKIVRNVCLLDLCFTDDIPVWNKTRVSGSEAVGPL